MITAIDKPGKQAANGRQQDHRTDDRGDFLFGFERVEVPYRRAKASSEILLIEKGPGVWLAAHGIRQRWGDGRGFEAGLSIRSEEYETRSKAILGQLDQIAEHWSALKAAGDAKARAALTDVTKFRQEVVQLAGDVLFESAEGRAITPPAAGSTPPAAIADESKRTMAAEEMVFLDVEISQIDCSKNPRKFFDQAKIDALADSIEKHGLQQKPIVRAMHGNLGKRRYELIGGGRRLAALQKLGRKSATVDVRELDDAEAEALRGILNLDAESFTPIEEAEWCLAMTRPKSEGGLHGLTQAELAKQRGKDPSWVSNRIRLLELPTWWQDRVISQEILATHARVVLAYKDFPELLAKLQKQVSLWINAKDEDDRAAEMSVAQFTENIEWIARRETEELDGYTWLSGLGSIHYKVKPSDQERQQLRIVKVGDEERAINKKLAAKLLGQAKQTAIDAAQAKGKGKGKSADGAGEKKKAPTPAQVAAKKKERAGQLTRKIKEVRFDWLRMLCSNFFLSGPCSDLAAEKLLLVVAVETNLRSHMQSGQLRRAVDGAVREKRSHSLWNGIAMMKGPELDKLLRESLAACLFDHEAEAPQPDIDDDVVEGLARLLKIKPQDAWTDAKMGPLTQRYFELRTKDELVALGEIVGQFLEPGQSKETMIGILSERRYPMPKELGLEDKADSGKRKAGKKR